MGLSRFLYVLATAALGVASVSTARAEDIAAPERIDLNADPARASSMAEAGIGLLSLPGAELCSNLSCTTGDQSLMLEAWQLIRPQPQFALGAGITLGLIPTSEAPAEQPLNPTDGDEPASWIDREHSRGYFTAEATGRFYPLTGVRTEAWVGVTTGLVIVSDTFSSTEDAPDKAFVGPRGVTLRSEGFGIGVAAGGAYAFGHNWFAGGSLRYANWFLPQNPATSAFGDEAALTGRVSVFILGVTIAYRVPL